MITRRSTGKTASLSQAIWVKGTEIILLFHFQEERPWNNQQDNQGLNLYKCSPALSFETNLD